MNAALLALVLAVSGPTVPPMSGERPDPAAVATPEPAPAPASTPAEPQIEKAKKAEKPPLEVTGRVYARESFGPAGVRDDARDPWTGRFSLESARVGAKYTADDVFLEVEAELEGEPRLRDAYVILQTGFYGTAVQAGQFKSPFAALAMESSWTLPTVERGLLDELLIDRLQIGGRRPGAQIEWKGAKHGGLRPKLEAGLWQGTDQDGEPRRDATSETIAETAGARASMKSDGGIEAGLSGAWRTAQPVLGGPFERFWAAGADLTIETESRVRAWLESGAGSSWADDDPTDEKHATFGYARSVAAWRLGGAEKGDPYLEPFLAAGAIDPDVAIISDLVLETGAGLNAGRWKRWRGQVQWLRSECSRNTPASLLGEIPRESEAVLFQIGVSI